MADTNQISLIQGAECRVSSVLSKNSREYGKQFLTDGSQETCWSSDQGSPQWVALKWNSEVNVHKIEATFQGGFCGTRDSIVEIWTETNRTWEQISIWPLEDVGTCQSLTLPEPTRITRLRLQFPASTDFFGRIIMYTLDVLGNNI